MARRNDLTDVPGFRVGSVENEQAGTGCTVVLCPDDGAIGGVELTGGAPGTRETDPLRPLHLVERCHAVVLAGGSAFGLDAAGGVVRYLEQRGIGFPTSVARVPIVPAAVIYDLGIGSATVRPDAAMGEAACTEAEKGEAMRLGNAGAGCGATVGKILGPGGAMKGGIGSASAEPVPGLLVGVLAVVNAFGDVVDPATGGLLAGARTPGSAPDATSFADTVSVLRKRSGQPLAFGSQGTHTVLGVVATNARLDKQEANLLARMARAGLARTIRPAHTMLDGDTIFALSAGDPPCDVNLLGAVAADLIGMAVMRGVLNAKSIHGIPSAGEIRGKARGLRIRSGGPEDREAVAELMTDLPEWFRPESIEEAGVDLDRYESLIAEIEGRLVGFLIHGPSAIHPEPDLVKIHWLGVSRSHRGRGIGQALVRCLEDLVRRQGGGVVELMTVADTDLYPPYADTRAFYRAVGFEEFFTDAGAVEEYGCEMLTFRKRIDGV